MSRSPTIDAARIELMLTELRLPAMKAAWAEIAAQAEKEGWPASRFLAALAEHEMADRSRRRIARHLAGSELPDGKTIESFEFELVPMVSKAQVKALVAGDSWLRSGANLLLFGGQGVGKSHLGAAIGRGLVENGWRVFYTRTSDLVQRLQVARRDLVLEAAIAKLDGVNPHAWLSDTLTKLMNRWPASGIDDQLPNAPHNVSVQLRCSDVWPARQSVGTHKKHTTSDHPCLGPAVVGPKD